MVLIFVNTLILGLLLTWLAMKLNIMDQPDSRKIHKNAVPKAGGIGIIVPVIIVLIWNARNGPEFMNEKDIAVPAILVILLIVGIIDDKIELSAKAKLLFEIVIAIATLSAGITLNISSNVYLNYLITVLWVVGFINAMNLIDGLDGLAGGIGFITAGGVLIFSIQYASEGIAILAVALMGSLLGFLYWNRHPAKIFMGDTGSLPLGYLLSVMIISTGNAIGGFGGAAIAFFLAAVPVYDTALSIIRRKVNKRPVFSADRSHFYNLLMDQKGFSHKNTVNVIYGINLTLVVAALVLNHIQPLYRYSLAILLILSASVGSIKAGFLTVDSKQGSDKK